jgi:MFS family permease
MKRLSPPIEFALRISIFEGSMFAIYWNIVAGVIINGLMLALGASPMQLALLNSLPFLSQAFGLHAAKVIQTTDVRKRFCLTMEGISRAMWIPIPFVIIFLGGSQLSIWIILLIAGVAQCTHWGGAVSWLSWVSDLVPEQIRGVYFGMRNSITAFVGMLGLTVASLWADGVKKELGEGKEYLNTLLILIGIAILFSAISWIGLSLQPVRSLKNMATSGYKAIWDTLSTRNGKKIALSWVLFTFAVGFQAAFNTPFFLHKLNMSMMGVTVTIWIILTLATVTTPLWGRISDVIGYKKVLIIGWAGVFWLPLLFVFTKADAPHIFGIAPWGILADAFFTSIFWPAVGIAQTNIVIGQASSQTRAGLFAVLSALTGAAGFVAAMIAGQIGNHIGDTAMVNFAGLEMNNMQVPMLIGSVLRFLAGFMMFFIEEPQRTQDMIPNNQAFSIMRKLLLGRPG